ncbi:unnamed protein product [Parajaminaea phylloscopi]
MPEIQVIRAVAEAAAAAMPSGPAAPSMDLSLGCMFIGMVFNVFLYGMSVVQGYMYFINFKSDKLFMRIFVGLLLVADTLNCVMDTGFMYQYLISNFGDLQYASQANRMFATDPVLTGIIAFSCQAFFAWRVYRLMHSWVVPSLILLVGGASLLSAIGTTIGVEIVLVFAEFQRFQVVVILWLACAALADMIITVSLVWTLQKSRTGFTATDDVITRLIRGTIQTGMATTVFAVTDLILFCASTTTLHLVFNLPLAKLYVNSLLSTLNARALIANAQRGPTMDASSSGQMHGVNSTAKRQSRFRPTNSGSDTLASPTNRGFKKSIGFGGAGPGVANNRLDLEAGIQVTTVEERFEESHMSTEMDSLPHMNHDRPGFIRSEDSRETLHKSRSSSDELRRQY